MVEDFVVDDEDVCESVDVGIIVLDYGCLLLWCLLFDFVCLVYFYDVWYDGQQWVGFGDGCGEYGLCGFVEFGFVCQEEVVVFGVYGFEEL